MALLSLIVLQASVARVHAEALTRRTRPARPNIIMVYIDDMGWSDLSCFGGKAVETENIDRLAAEGIRITNFYVHYDGSQPQLYDLETDISETRNVATEHPEIVRDLKQSVLDWNAGLPADAGDTAY